MPRKTQSRGNSKQVPVDLEDITWDFDDGMPPAWAGIPSIDIFADLSRADERAYALFRKILDDAFSAGETSRIKRKSVPRRNGKRAASPKGKSPSRKKATPNSPPARRVSAPRKTIKQRPTA